MMMSYLYPTLLTLLMLQCQNEAATQPNHRTDEAIVSDGIKLGQEFTLERFEQAVVYGGKAPRRLHVNAQQIATPVVLLM